MAIKLVKKSTNDEFSYETELDPVTLSAIVDGSGTPTTVDSTTVNFEIRASTYEYEDIVLSIHDEDSGINYKLSLNNVNWHDALTSGLVDDLVNGVIGDMDGTGSDELQDVYIKAVITNDGSVDMGSYSIPSLRLDAKEI